MSELSQCDVDELLSWHSGGAHNTSLDAICTYQPWKEHSEYLRGIAATLPNPQRLISIADSLDTIIDVMLNGFDSGRRVGNRWE